MAFSPTPGANYRVFRAEYQELIRDRRRGYRIELQTNAELHGEVPQWWLDVNDNDAKTSVDHAIAHWESIVGNRLPRLMRYIQRTCIDIYVARVISNADPAASIPVMLYCFAGFRSMIPVRTRIALPPTSIGALPSYWDQFPPELQSFYTSLHNGFIDDLLLFGLLPVGEFRSTPTCRSLLGCVRRNDVDPTKLIEICADATGGMLCIDTSDASGTAWDVYPGKLTRQDLWPTLDDILTPG